MIEKHYISFISELKQKYQLSYVVHLYQQIDLLLCIYISSVDKHKERL